jgi:hypothetical protein
MITWDAAAMERKRHDASSSAPLPTSNFIESLQINNILISTLTLSNMSATRFVFRSLRPSMALKRPFSTTSRRIVSQGNAKEHEGTAEHRKIQSDKPLNPHMTNTNSTIANEMPSVGAQKAPPELISSIDPNFVPEDSVPENTERMTGGMQKGGSDAGPNAEMGVGEMEGAKFKVEPLRRTGEDANTMRARLLCSCRL